MSPYHNNEMWVPCTDAKIIFLTSINFGRAFPAIKDKTSGKVALDIGANVGLYSSAMLLAGFEHVHSFEPNHEIRDILVKKNLSNFDDASYTFHHYGIMEETKS